MQITRIKNIIFRCEGGGTYLMTHDKVKVDKVPII